MKRLLDDALMSVAGTARVRSELELSASGRAGRGDHSGRVRRAAIGSRQNFRLPRLTLTSAQDEPRSLVRTLLLVTLAALPIASVHADTGSPAPSAPITTQVAEAEPWAPVPTPRVSWLSEGFNDITTLAGNGWFTANLSQPLGTSGWFQGNPQEPPFFPSHLGAPNAYIGADSNNATHIDGTISNWLITPELSFGNGAQLQFWTRRMDEAWSPDPDRLEVRLSHNGASTHVGATANSVGDFGELLLSINPGLTVGVYPTVWTQYTVTGLPRNGSGRIAFRYFVPRRDASYIGIDTVSYNAGPPVPVYRVRGTVSGLIGTGLTLALNGGTPQTIADNGLFAFPTDLSPGASYAVTIVAQPAGPSQICSISGAGEGVIGNANVDLTIECETILVPVGGVVSGLVGSGLVLANNLEDHLVVPGNGPFQFETLLLVGEPYLVTVHSEPQQPSQRCTVANAWGLVGITPIQNVAVVCEIRHFWIGGEVSGLSGGQLVLRLNDGDDLVVEDNDYFSFPTQLPDLSSFVVTVASQPSDPPQTCTVSNGDGQLNGGDFLDLRVDCELGPWTVAATILDGNGTVTPASQQIPDGQPASITVTPDADWFTLSVVGDACEPEDQGDGEWTLSEVLAPCAIAVRFARTSLDVTAAVALGEGTITPALQTPLYGEAAEFTVTPGLAWRTAQVLGDTCTPQDQGEGIWRAQPIVEDCVVSAGFEAARINALLGGGQSTAVGSNFALPLVVHVSTPTGEPWPGLSVRFTASESGASATLSAKLVETDAQGFALVHATANLTTGSYEIVAILDDADGIAPTRFVLSNGVGSIELAAEIDNGQGYIRYGRVSDYLVRLGNTGLNPVFGVDLASELSEGLDQGAARWLCLTPASGCTVQGSGALVDEGLQIAPGAEVLWLYSVPVRLDTEEDTVMARVEAAAGGTIVDAADLDAIVLFRNGFNSPYELMAPSPAPPAEQVPMFSVDRFALAAGEPRALVARDVGGSQGPTELALADLGNETSVQVQQLAHGGHVFVRMVLHRPAGARISTWLPLPEQVTPWLVRHGQDGRGAIALEADGALIELSLD